MLVHQMREINENVEILSEADNLPQRRVVTTQPQSQMTTTANGEEQKADEEQNNDLQDDDTDGALDMNLRNASSMSFDIQEMR